MSHEDNICIKNDEETTQRLCEAVLLDKHTRRYLENISGSVRVLGKLSGDCPEYY